MIDCWSIREKLTFWTEDSLLGVDVGADGYTTLEEAAAWVTVEEAAACRRPKRRRISSWNRIPEMEYWPLGLSSVIPKSTFIEAHAAFHSTRWTNKTAVNLFVL